MAESIKTNVAEKTSEGVEIDTGDVLFWGMALFVLGVAAVSAFAPVKKNPSSPSISDGRPPNCS